jgi:hypothetical protein
MDPKHCSRCNTLKPLAEFTLSTDRNGARRPNSWCKVCCATYAAEKRRAAGIPTREQGWKAQSPDGLKTCQNCKVDKPLEQFYKRTNGLYGVSTICKQCYKPRKAGYIKTYRMECLIHYSQDPPFCACCGETTYEFLCIDHINGGGAQHAQEIGRGKIYRWLINNSFPIGFRVLCHNCNLSLGYYGYCPHQHNSD